MRHEGTTKAGKGSMERVKSTKVNRMRWINGSIVHLWQQRGLQSVPYCIVRPGHTEQDEESVRRNELIAASFDGKQSMNQETGGHLSQQNGVREDGQKQYEPGEIPASKVRFGEGRKGNNKSYLVLNIKATSNMA